MAAENDETDAKYEVNIPLLTSNLVSHAHRQKSTKQTSDDDGVIELLEDVQPEESKKRNINFENGSDKNVTSVAVTWPNSNGPSTYDSHKQACDNGNDSLLVSHPPRYLPTVPLANTFTAMMQNRSHPNNICYNNPSMLNAPLQYMPPSYHPVEQKQRQQQFFPPLQHSQTRQQFFNPPPPPPPPPNNYLKNYISLLRSVIGVRVPHLVSVETYCTIYPVSDILI